MALTCSRFQYHGDDFHDGMMTAMLQKNDDNGGTGSVAMPDVVLGVT